MEELFIRFIQSPWRKYKDAKHLHDYEPRPDNFRFGRQLNESEFNQQQTSMFFTRLPIEIRLSIYKLVIIGHRPQWHFTECRNYKNDCNLSRRRRNTLGVYKTREKRIKEGSLSSHLSSTVMKSHCYRPHEIDRSLLRALPSLSDMSLARTCHRMYLEVGDLPYSKFQYHTTIV